MSVGPECERDREIAAVLFAIGEERVMRAVRLLNAEAEDRGWVPHEHGDNCGGMLDGQFIPCRAAMVRDTRWRDPKVAI